MICYEINTRISLVGQKHFVSLQPFVPFDTQAQYRHMTAWLMEHALQIRAERFRYSFPDRALTPGPTCVFLLVC